MSAVLFVGCYVVAAVVLIICVCSGCGVVVVVAAVVACAAAVAGVLIVCCVSYGCFSVVFLFKITPFSNKQKKTTKKNNKRSDCFEGSNKETHEKLPCVTCVGLLFVLWIRGSEPVGRAWAWEV